MSEATFEHLQMATLKKQIHCSHLVQCFWCSSLFEVNFTQGHPAAYKNQVKWSGNTYLSLATRGCRGSPNGLYICVTETWIAMFSQKNPWIKLLLILYYFCWYITHSVYDPLISTALGRILVIIEKNWLHFCLQISTLFVDCPQNFPLSSVHFCDCGITLICPN